MYDLITSFTETKQKINYNYLVNLDEKRDLITGEDIIKGELENLKVKQNCNGVSIFGSLPKYLFGNNLYSITRKATEQAIEKISDELLLNVKDSRIYRIDVAGNFKMKKLLKHYLVCLGDLNYFQYFSNHYAHQPSMGLRIQRHLKALKIYCTPFSIKLQRLAKKKL